LPVPSEHTPGKEEDSFYGYVGYWHGEGSHVWVEADGVVQTARSRYGAREGYRVDSRTISTFFAEMQSDHGSNAFPPDWERIAALVEELTGRPFRSPEV